jgi:hypothetical protein
MSANVTLRDLAKMIDHSLLHPTTTDADIRAGFAVARRHDTATVCVKPYSISMCRDLPAGSDVKVCSVIGFPHGNGTTAIKAVEAEAAVLRLYEICAATSVAFVKTSSGYGFVRQPSGDYNYRGATEATCGGCVLTARHGFKSRLPAECGRWMICSRCANSGARAAARPRPRRCCGRPCHVDSRDGRGRGYSPSSTAGTVTGTPIGHVKSMIELD